MKLEFPKGFLWGGATAAEQSEGHGNTGKGLTVWDELIKTEPDLFWNQVGPAKTNNFFTHYKEDIAMWKEIGANSVRTDFSWSRLFPDGVNVSQEGVDFYHKVLDEMLAKGIEPIMTLYHFDTPLWAGKIGGFENKEVVDKFVAYAKFVFAEFGDKVLMITTNNEPIVPVMAGYMGGPHYPRVTDLKRAVAFGYGEILAHAKTVKVYNDEFRGKIKAQIGTVINVAPAYAKDGQNFSKEDEHAAFMFNVLHNYSMLDPMILGTFPKELVAYLKEHDLMPDYTQEELDIIKETKIDFVGVNYYAPARVQAPTDPTKEGFEGVAEAYTWPEMRKNVFRGWEIYPKGIYDAAIIIKERYNNLPFFISENGMGVQNEHLYRGDNGEIQDDYRISFITEHLEWLHKAIQEGSQCLGYHMWAIFDCWSWANAYKNTYGFIEVDIETEKRTVKKSGRWLKEVATANAIDSEYKKIEEYMDLKNIEFIESVGMDKENE